MRHQSIETGLCEPRNNGMTVGQKVVLHLFRNKTYNHRYVAPFEVCQLGIAEGVGVSRAHVAVELGYLREKCFIAKELRYI